MTTRRFSSCRRTTNERASVLQCGEMLSAVLLEATMAGLATCTLTHITELWPGRNVVASLIGQTTTPQLLIRVGSAPEIEDNAAADAAAAD